MFVLGRIQAEEKLFFLKKEKKEEDLSGGRVWSEGLFSAMRERGSKGGVPREGGGVWREGWLSAMR